MQLLTPIYKLEIAWLHSFQNLPIFDENWESFWLLVTKLGDPAWAFFIYFPILLPFWGNTAFKMLLVASISEYSNGILKWLMHGERPYWYVQEHEGFASLKQFKWTCETGPGSPSGHVMGSAAVFWILVQHICQEKDKQFKLLAHSLYGFLLLLIAVSRLYIAAHFPHQVAFGLVAGILLGMFINCCNPEYWSLQRWLILAAAMSFGCKLVHDGLLFYGFDPAWSITKAFKYCTKAEWVHMSTTPVASFFRDLSTVFTLGFVVHKSPIYSQQYKVQSFYIKLIYSAISLISSQVLSKIPRPEYEEMHFYGMTSICNVLNVLLVGLCIPHCAIMHNQALKTKNN